MNRLGFAIRRALTQVRALITGLGPAGRWPLAVAVVAASLVSALGQTTPARADPPPDPDARLQLVIKSIYIRENENLIGSADLDLLVQLCSDDGTHAYDDSFLCGGAGFANILYGFSASSGDNIVLDRVVPRAGDSMSGDASPEAGLPVYRGQRYVLEFDMSNIDLLGTGDSLGTVFIHVDAEHGWGIGANTVRSTNGDFVVSYELRRTPLPDLAVSSFQVTGLPGSESVCGRIENVGPEPADPAGLDLSTEGRVVEHTAVPALDPGAGIWHCIERSSLPTKKHNLVFSLDQARAMPEMDELNNVNFVTVEADPSGAAPDSGASTGAGPVAAPSPQPPPGGDMPDPSGDKADLVVRALRVNGQAPDGKNDCNVGRNDVTVVIKDAGEADAGSFSVRLTVDGDTRDTTVASIRAGEEREVSFDNVTLKKGDHTLRAVADPDHAVTESKDDNNELKVTARCQG